MMTKTPGTASTGRTIAHLLAGTGMFCSIASLAVAGTQQSTDSEGPALTVYSTADPAGFDPQEFISSQGTNDSSSYARFIPGFAVVRETRQLEIEKGLSELRFTDVAAFIDPTSVGFTDLTSRGTTVLEQNFEFDLVSPAKLLKKYIDREVTLNWDAGGQSMTGTLLSANGSMAVLDVSEHMEGAAIQIVPTKDARISMGELPGGLITRPTLVWKVNSPVAGKHDIQTSYQTAGITWRADYNLVLGQDETSADLTAWVSLLNVSGSSYENARLKLVAGDVQRIQPQRLAGMARGARMMEADSFGGGGGFEEESFFEYHLYTLPRRTDVKANGTQQLTLFPPIRGFKVTKELLFQGAPGLMRGNWPNNPSTNAGYGVVSDGEIEIFVEFENKKDNGLGMPMPAGKIRAYKENPSDGSLVFIGEDVIDHTPRNETVRLKIGNAFDVVGERTQVDFKVNTTAKTMTETWSIEIRNQKSESQKVIVREPLYRWRNWAITKSSDEYTKLNARTIQWDLDVPAEGSRTITYTVKYTW
ncbi:MAG: DUF4139 domain-containing protein [Phycisphaerales bacterium]|nr:DUF4139 domain-containing protein [Phycisphaerales bacterium]